MPTYVNVELAKKYLRRCPIHLLYEEIARRKTEHGRERDLGILAARMSELQITQADMARLLECSPQSVNNAIKYQDQAGNHARPGMVKRMLRMCDMIAEERARLEVKKDNAAARKLSKVRYRLADSNGDGVQEQRPSEVPAGLGPARQNDEQRRGADEQGRVRSGIDPSQSSAQWP